jgi:FG-GAP-like repeat
VPQKDGGKLFRNDSKGRFTDVTEKSGDLAKLSAHATSAAWGDLDNDGRLDLVIGCLKGPNRYFRNKGDGTFEDASESVGFTQKVFNTQAVCLVDLNNDGLLDVVFNNEGQESAVLLGDKEVQPKRTPLTLQVAGTAGVVGSCVKVLDKEGKALLGSVSISGGDGRGGQAAPQARFALPPGTYRVEVQYTSGVRRAKEVVVAGSPVRGVIDDQTPKVE